MHVSSDRILSNISAETLREHLKDTELVDTYRHGKHLFTETASGEWLRMHFGMTGRLKYFKKNSSRPEHVMVLLDFKGGYSLAWVCVRKLGRMGLVKDVDSFVMEKGLGPDALKLEEDEFVDILGKKRGYVKSSLMDQETISGLGNIYTDEILFQSGIHPRTPVGELDEGALRSLFLKTGEVLEEAIECAADPQAMPDDYLLPHRGEDGNCPVCGDALKKIKISGRTTYYCPKRQAPEN